MDFLFPEFVHPLALEGVHSEGGAAHFDVDAVLLAASAAEAVHHAGTVAVVARQEVGAEVLKGVGPQEVQR